MACRSLTFTTTTELADTHVAACWLAGMLGCEQEGLVVRAFFDERADLDGLARQLSRTGASETAVATVVEQDWNKAWRESMQPARLTPDIWVSPQWLPPALAAGQHWIRIEPKMAFGTGHHETTRLAARSILTIAPALPRREALLDIGAGSGVLCFCAGLAGFEYSLGVELDADCAENLAENRRLNADLGRADFVVGTLDALRPTSFDLVVMNMIFNESAPLLRRVAGLLAPHGVLVWSGILVGGREEACDAAKREGFTLASECQENEWWAGVFRILPAMSNESRPARVQGSIFTLLAGLFRKHNVRAVLVGGYALNASKVQRMTFDIDFVVTAEDREKLEPDILAAGYGVFGRQSAFVQFKSGQHGVRDLDLLVCDQHTVDRLVAEGRTARIAGETFIVPCPMHLIAMKLHAISGNGERELKDFPDVVNLITANGLDPASDAMKKLFRSYGAETLYARVLETTGAARG